MIAKLTAHQYRSASKISQGFLVLLKKENGKRFVFLLKENVFRFQLIVFVFLSIPETQKHKTENENGKHKMDSENRFRFQFSFSVFH